MSLDFDGARLPNPHMKEEHLAWRAALRRFIDAEIMPYASDWDEAGAMPNSLWPKAAEVGLLGLGYPEAFGGVPGDSWHAWIVNEELARIGVGGVPASLMVHGIGLPPILNWGTEAMQAEIAPPILRGEKWISLGISEPGGGSDVANLSTTAVRDGDHYVVTGSKTYITGGMRANWVSTAVRTGEAGAKGVSMLLIPTDAQGFSRTPLDRKMGWWASDTATLYFDECKIPAANLMGEEHKGFYAIMNNFNYERFWMAAQMLGMSMRLFDESVAYAQDRQTFNQPLIKHQVIRHKLADMSARIDAMDAYLNQVAEITNTGEMPVAEISKLKFYCSTNLEWIASEAMQIFGGAGYLRGNAVERIYREVKVQAIGGGSQEIMRDLTVKQMGL